jgi:hypothetical protein
VLAGVCTIAARLWSSGKGKSWLLAINGLALSAFGLISLFWQGPLSFRAVSLLFVVVGMSIGIQGTGNRVVPAASCLGQMAS